MFRDAQTALWEAAALTVSAVSTNSYDCGVPGVSGGLAQDVSIGEGLRIVLSVGVAADHTTGDETYEFDIIQSAAAALTAPDVLAQYPFTAAQATAGALALGTILVMPLPVGQITKRYVGAQYVGGGTTPTITVTAWITDHNMAQLFRTYGTRISVL